MDTSRLHGRGARRTPLAGCLAIALALATETQATGLALPWIARPTAPTAIPVANCNDAGPGSLRAAVDEALSGDIIDLSALTCGTITLTTGAITTLADDLTLQGPGSALLAIDAGYSSQNFVHLGSGTLTLADLTLQNGRKYASGSAIAKGGCVYSKGNILLDGTTAKYCRAEAVDGAARGGALYAIGSISLVSSTLSHNSATSSGGDAFGGGLLTLSSMSMAYSTLEQNVVTAPSSGAVAIGGAAVAQLGASVVTSTLSGNRAGSAAALFMANKYEPSPVAIVNSTIADNRATTPASGGAMVVLASTFEARNSTISGNVCTLASGSAPGAAVDFGVTPMIDVRSSILAGNVCTDGTTTLAADVSGATPGSEGTVIVGNNNLIGHSGIPMPADTIVDDDPGLSALAFNGGPTKTRMPHPASVGVDRGSNAGGLANDQRGSGYPRVAGAAADIGAVETAVDSIFTDGFD